MSLTLIELLCLFCNLVIKFRYTKDYFVLQMYFHVFRVFIMFKHGNILSLGNFV